MRYKNKAPNYFRSFKIYDKTFNNLPAINNIQNLCRVNRNNNPLSKFSRMSFKHKKSYRRKTKLNINFPNKLFLFLGALLLFFGVVGILGNTVVFTPMFMRGSVGGASFGLSSILLFLGIAIVFFKRRSLIGYGFVILGVLCICVSVFSSLRVGFLPTSLVKTVLIFGSVFAGLGLLLKWIFKKR